MLLSAGIDLGAGYCGYRILKCHAHLSLILCRIASTRGAFVAETPGFDKGRNFNKLLGCPISLRKFVAYNLFFFLETVVVQMALRQVSVGGNSPHTPLSSVSGLDNETNSITTKTVNIPSGTKILKNWCKIFCVSHPLLPP